MKIESLLIMAGAATAAYLFFSGRSVSSKVEQPQQAAPAPVMPPITPVIVVPPVITPAASQVSTTTYDVKMEAPTLPPIPKTVEIVVPSIPSPAPAPVVVPAPAPQPAYVAPAPKPAYVAPTPLQKILAPVLNVPPPSEQEVKGRQLSAEHAPGWGVFAPTKQGYEALAQHNAPANPFNIFEGGFPWL